MVVQERFVAKNAKRYSNLLGDRTGMVFDDDDSFCGHTIFRGGFKSGQSTSNFVAGSRIDGLGTVGLYSATDRSAVG